MKSEQNFLYANDEGMLQVPYTEYTGLIEKVEEAQRLQQVKTTVLADLQTFIGDTPVPATAPKEPKAESTPNTSPSQAKEPVSEKISIEFSEDTPGPSKQQASAAARDAVSGIPPIKKDIIAHFNKLDGSGRLLNVFKQYYTCLNESCGGTVRVTMKDGFCSLWNYDEWEEFAFVDIFENLLRITLDSSYTDALKSQSLCEVPRLISSRRNVVSVQVDDLNNVVLNILAKAFSEAGVQTK